jgi:hypothetical protein
MPSLLFAFFAPVLLATHTLAASAPSVGIDRNLAELPNMVIHEKVERCVGAGAKSRRLDRLTTTVEAVGRLERY